MKKWKGIQRKTSPVDDDDGVSHYQENTRLNVDGELRRRHGFARSSIEKIATQVYGISSLVAPVPGVVLQGTAGSIFGYSAFTPQWGDMILKAPTGTAVQNSSYTYTTGDSVNRSVNYSTASVFSSPMEEAIFTDAASPINTGGVNGETYKVIFNSHFSAVMGVLTLRYIHLKGTFSVASTLFSAGNANSWAFTGGTSGVQGDQHTTTIDTTKAGFGVTVDGTHPVNLTGSSGTYTTFDQNTWLVPGGTTITMEADAYLFTGGHLPFTITGDLQFSTQMRVAPDLTQWTITVNRAEAFDTSYDIFTKDGSYPNDPSDGIYAGTLTINPGSASTSSTMTAPGGSTSANWKWVAVPISAGSRGPWGRLT